MDWLVIDNGTHAFSVHLLAAQHSIVPLDYSTLNTAAVADLNFFIRNEMHISGFSFSVQMVGLRLLSICFELSLTDKKPIACDPLNFYVNTNWCCCCYCFSFFFHSCIINFTYASLSADQITEKKQKHHFFLPIYFVRFILFRSIQPNIEWKYDEKTQQPQNKHSVLCFVCTSEINLCSAITQ